MSLNNRIPDKCIWQVLAECKKPIIMYGTGNGGDKILDECEKRGINISGVFASSDFVRRRVWRGMEVLSYNEIINRFGREIVILLVFGSSRPEVMEYFDFLALQHEFYIPEVPLYGGEIFDLDSYLRHKDEINRALDILSDNESKELMEDLILFRLTGSPAYLNRTISMKEQVASLLDCREVKRVIDCGAYKGDSTAVFAKAFPDSDEIIAVEPDPASFKRLCAYCNDFNSSSDNRTELKPMLYAVGEQDKTTEFLCTGSRGSGRSGSGRIKLTQIEERRIDTLSSGRRIDFIKLDVEGDEMQALRGAENTLRQSDCALTVSVYHRTEDLYSILLYLHNKYPQCSFFLRREKCIPAWDINLWMIPERTLNKNLRHQF